MSSEKSVQDSSTITAQFPCLEVQIFQPGQHHLPQKIGDETIYEIKLSSDQVISLDEDCIDGILGCENKTDENQEEFFEDEQKTVSIKKSVIDNYRIMKNYFGPLRIVSEKRKSSENGVMKETYHAKLLHIDFQAKDKEGNVIEVLDMKGLISRTPGIIPAYEPGKENLSDDKNIHLVLGNNEKYFLPKRVVSVFEKVANVLFPFNIKVQKLTIVKNGNSTALTILNLSPGNDAVIYKAISVSESKPMNNSNKLNDLKTTKHSFNNYNLNNIHWARRGSTVLKDINKMGVDFLNKIVVENFLVTDSLRDLGNSYVINKQDQSTKNDQINGSQNIEPYLLNSDSNQVLWDYLINAVQNLCLLNVLIKFQFEMGDEKWVEIKRTVNMFHINSEIVPDIVLKVSYLSTDNSKLIFYLRCLGRVIKSHQISCKQDIVDLLKCMERNRYICHGLFKDSYLEQVDYNQALAIQLMENAYLCQMPFEAFYSKDCKAIIKEDDPVKLVNLKRGSAEVSGPSLLCYSCLLLKNKLASTMDPNFKTQATWDSDKRNIAKYAPAVNAKISDNIKGLFTQTPSQFVTNSRRKRKLVETTDNSRNGERGVIYTKAWALRQKNLEKKTPSTSLTEEEFGRMISIEKDETNSTLRKSCLVCGYEGANMLEFFSHMSEHLKSFNEKCNFCGLKFSDTEALSLHKETCLKTSEIKCSKCRKKFKTYDKLFDHFIVHRYKRTFVCKYCADGFKSSKHYKEHLSLLHRISTIKELNYECSHCESFFLTQDQLFIHRLNWNHKDHQNQFKCPICDFHCVSNLEFFAHLGTHSFSEREEYNLAVCFDCNKVFFSSLRLEHHRLYKHNSNPQIDEDPFAIQSSIELHVDTEPVSETTCMNCLKPFAYPSVLQNHILSEHPCLSINDTTVRYYGNHTCMLCGRKFFTSHLLELHTIQIHDANRDKPVYQCELCGHVYSARKEVMKHIKREHTEAIIKYQKHRAQNKSKDQSDVNSNASHICSIPCSEFQELIQPKTEADQIPESGPLEWDGQQMEPLMEHQAQEYKYY